MNIAEETSEVIQDAVDYALERQYEYITPEMVLLILCEYPFFQESFESCGGSVEELASDLEGYLLIYVECVDGAVPEFSMSCGHAFAYAGQSALNSGNNEIGIQHLIHGLWQLKDNYAVYYMQKQGVKEAELLRAMTNFEEEYLAGKIQEEEPDEDEEELPFGPDASDQWKLYAPCLNETLQGVNPLIGREAELERTIQILCRKDKNNPLHIGEPGVGKTALTYGLVQRINEKKVPGPLLNSKVFALDLGGMVAGTQYRGDFEKRFKKVLGEIEKEEAPILYIDEIHTLSGAGAVGEGSLDASNMLKPYLASGHIRFIGATTFDEHKKYFEKNKSLARRFQNVEIKEPTEEEALEILKGLKSKYEDFHGVVYGNDVLEYAVAMSAKHIHERFLPDKAIDLLDEAGAYRKLHPLSGGVQLVDKAVVSQVLTNICRIPLETVKTDETEGLATLEDRLKGRVFGQDEAVSQVVNAIKFSRAGLLEEGKPLASLLFVGPTGVGKTEIAKSLAEELGVKLIRFDMSEYGEKHAVAKLIGSPAGYVGYEEGGLLTEEIRRHPYAVLLLDEIEKAHPDIYNVLLQVMDYATLTDNQGRKAEFGNVVLIMTSNAGASRVGKKGIGFERKGQDNSVILEEVRHTFQPEFRNRLNRTVVFRSMDDEMAIRVVKKKIGELKAMLAKKRIRLHVNEEALQLIKKKGISPEFGAREVERIIRNELKPLLVDDILFGDLKDGGELSVTVLDGGFSTSVRKS